MGIGIPPSSGSKYFEHGPTAGPGRLLLIINHAVYENITIAIIGSPAAVRCTVLQLPNKILSLQNCTL